MNQNLTRKLYPLLGLALGLVGAGCRFLLYALGVDEKGLLVPGHPAAIALWVVTAAAVLAAVLAAVTFREDNKAPDETCRSIPEALGTAVMALGVLSTLLLPENNGIATLLRLHRILAVLAFFCLLAAAVFRLMGKPVPFGCYAGAAVFFFVHVVTRYRAWSGNPQMADYLHALGAGLCLSLVSYYETALVVGLGGRRQRFALGILGIFCCVAAAARGEYPLMHLCGAVWILSVLLTVRPGESKES
ncbi:MAG: hypothetical protein ACI4P4_15085 [Faecousia sp.]